MGSLRRIISIYLLVVGALVALQMVFDSFYLGSADAIWGVLGLADRFGDAAGANG